MCDICWMIDHHSNRNLLISIRSIQKYTAQNIWTISYIVYHIDGSFIPFVHYYWLTMAISSTDTFTHTNSTPFICFIIIRIFSTTTSAHMPCESKRRFDFEICLCNNKSAIYRLMKNVSFSALVCDVYLCVCGCGRSTENNDDAIWRTTIFYRTL